MDIVLTGSVAFDYLMTFPGYFRDHILPDKIDSISLSFLVESMVRLRGGIAPNIAYTLALFGERPRILSAVGEDFGEYREWLESKGVDTRDVKVIPGVYTASFFANTDRSNAQISSFYAGAMGYSVQLSLKEMEGPLPDLVAVSPSDPESMKKLVRECKELGLPFIYDPSQQLVRLTVEEVREGIKGALALFVNDYEFGLIQKMTGLTPVDILEQARFLVVTRGEKGASVYSQDCEAHIPVVTADLIADPTGVGDAFRGGFLAGYSRGLSLDTCGRIGALAATYCLEHKGPQGHFYSIAEFTARYSQHFEDGEKLGVFLTKNPA